MSNTKPSLFGLVKRGFFMGIGMYVAFTVCTMIGNAVMILASSL